MALLNEPVMVLSKQQSDDLAGISTIEDSAMPEYIHISSTRLSTKNAACQTDLIIPAGTIYNIKNQIIFITHLLD